jgi:methionine-rich copper-binding protein CopC
MGFKLGFTGRLRTVQFGASIANTSTYLRCLGVAGFGVVFLLLGMYAAAAQPPRMLQSYPPAKAVVHSRDTGYSVRFDRPVDHEKSRLFITEAGRTMREMQPRLEAAPEVLYGTAVPLPPGEYELHWEVISLSGGEVTTGSVPFTVGR